MSPPPANPVLRDRNGFSSKEDYFKSISSLNRRLIDDMKTIRGSWGSKWDQLSYEEQCKIVDQSLVDEKTIIRYEEGDLPAPDFQYFPKLKMLTGQKVVCDENLSARGYTCRWRDEHSAPFSWHTRSQMDLTSDTPPQTPSNQHSNVPADLTTKGDRIISGPGSTYTAKTLPVENRKSGAFRWHYEPPVKSVDTPTVIQNQPFSPNSPASPTHQILVSQNVPNDSGRIVTWLKGVLYSITGACLPLKPCMATSVRLRSSLLQFHPPDILSSGPFKVREATEDTPELAVPLIIDSPVLIPPEMLKKKISQERRTSIDQKKKVVEKIAEEQINIDCLSIDFKDTVNILNGKDELPQLDLSTSNKVDIPKTGFDFLDDW